jgi:hypothetical protein
MGLDLDAQEELVGPLAAAVAQALVVTPLDCALRVLRNLDAELSRDGLDGPLGRVWSRTMWRAMRLSAADSARASASQPERISNRLLAVASLTNVTSSRAG